MATKAKATGNKRDGSESRWLLIMFAHLIEVHPPAHLSAWTSADTCLGPRIRRDHSRLFASSAARMARTMVTAGDHNRVLFQIRSEAALVFDADEKTAKCGVGSDEPGGIQERFFEL
ncbi:hypothetical protein PT974_01373 [Cladobotryum mycophilum]|uniref:Uncharacterized protein n=1 Tax=Cladobotryum mycophilum TaxID=491253 RepID=A0ABR0T3G3_9HYPO